MIAVRSADKTSPMNKCRGKAGTTIVVNSGKIYNTAFATKDWSMMSQLF